MSSSFDLLIMLCLKSFSLDFRAFRYFFDFMIFVNAWFIGFDLDEADWFFLGTFMLEIVLKLYTFGPREFFRVFWNV